MYIVNRFRGCCSSIGNGCRELRLGCKNFWWTKDDRIEADIKNRLDTKQLTQLKTYDLAYRITLIALVAAEIAGFALMAVACKTPSPIHNLTGLYVCVGSLVFFPTVLAIIQNRREAFCKAAQIDPDKTHVQPEEDDKSEGGDD